MFDRMADNDQLPEKISDASNTIEEFTGVNVPNVTAYKAITLAIPLVVGGPSTISQEPTRRPDENLPSQSQDTTVHEDKAEPVGTGSTTVSASLSVNYEALAQVSRKFTPGRIGFR